MGVRGLTSFIAKNSDRYFDTFELHDCSLVVDGNSLASLLYNLYAKCICAFGGDYDKYRNCVANFFISLKKSGVKPLVIFDGGYETRKLKTVMKRLRDKIRLARTISPISSKNKFFPLLMKEVFKDVLLDLEIPFAQCFLEADEEIAAIARQLNCPVLSYDSDFFVYDVFYIPFTSLDIKPLRRESKHVQDSDFFISCQIYNVENFLSHFGGLQKSMVPLMATLLGNDYISRSTFKRFFTTLKQGKRSSVGVTQRRILALLRWLQQWSDVDSAVIAILSFLKKERRIQTAAIIQRTVTGYTRCSSQLLPTLGLSLDTGPEYLQVTRDNSLSTISFDSDSDEESATETLQANEESGGSGDEYVEAQHENRKTDEDSEEEQEPEEGEEKGETEPDEEEEIYGGEEVVLEEVGVKADGKYVNRASLTVEHLPSWFKDLFCRGFLPSYLIDMLTLHTYFCSPQVEDYLLPSSHEISLPILTTIYSLMASAQKKSKALTYYPRNNRCQPEKRLLMPAVGVYPTLVGLSEMETAERRSILINSLGLNEKEDLAAINCFPVEWRLFMACVISWGRTCRSPLISNCHIHSVLFSVIALSVVDKNAGYQRTKLSKTFAGQVAKITHARKLASEVPRENHQHEFTLEEALSNISQDDCIILADKLLNFHEVDGKLRGNQKLYSLTTVHAFAQLQSVLYHAIHLNGLLDFPLAQCRPAKFFSGTLVYNAYTNFKKRADPSGYIDLILQPGNSVCELYKKLSQCSFDLLTNINVLQRKGNKRRKRPRGKEASYAADDTPQLSDEEENTYFDTSNKFYTLEMLNEND